MCARRKHRRPEPQEKEKLPREEQQAKIAKPVSSSPFVKPEKILRQIINNPNLGYQVMVVLLALTTDNVKMDRRISNMTTSLDSLRSMAEVLNTSVRSLQAAAEAPKQIRRLFKPDSK